ncbi:ferritin-like fold-containing protein [Isoptericola sp. NPDC056618]|uniref:ferritin-like fold-containing protein n=1 Tax=Isoptericola sp. NPDC056618 TaxID=3345878 RepID=UPI0036942727
MSEQQSTPDPALTTLVGLAAYTELAAFGLLAARSVDAPDLPARQTLATAAGEALGRQERLLDLVDAPEPDGSWGGGAAAAMAPFDGALADFDARTTPSGWAEGLLKSIVGLGVAQDLCRELAAGLPDGAAAFVAAVGEPRPDDPVTAVLAGAAAADGVLASRLALWGRRVVGEALGLVPVLLAAHPPLAALASRAWAAADDGGASAQAWLVSRLTAEHTRRMDRLGLAA